MSHDPSPFSPRDEALLAARGLSPGEVRRQIATMAHPPAPARLVRPCTLGDGIERLEGAAMERALARHAVARDAGRVTAFVPASGAATRMFRELLAVAARPGELRAAELREAAAAGDAEARAVVEWVAALPRFAFDEVLARALAARGFDRARLAAAGPWRPLLETLLFPGGLDYAALPKALLAFHRAPEGVRTAFEEHLAQSDELLRDAGGEARFHFTVPGAYRAAFEALLVRARGGPWGVTFSEQHPSTDTIAATPAGAPFRDDAGALVFRPSGHGALLRNLEALGADLLFLRNVDNVAVERLSPLVSRWSRALTGLADELASQAHALRARLDDSDDATAPEDAVRFVRARFVPDFLHGSREALAARLDRPVRVCGMVANTGEPGGGPFWVHGADGAVTRQIVESAQVAPEREQRAILAAATHFNPVFLACALRDAAGRTRSLEPFVDEQAVIVTRKSANGRELLALEHPGLWNGAMAGWNTVFVEAPIDVFNPVKTVFDLLRPAHQA
ncbi:MAG TPA: DUF4301 family protein [Candidatus Acidoferrales bacterium]|nr:DUF4301 family protein [Candidatus Acidoferrales bacterium]